MRYSELAAPSPYSNFSDLCSNTDAIQVVDIDADIAEIWSGLESPDTGKRTGRSPEIAISFSEHVSTERVSGLFRPVSCGGLPIRALSEDLGVYWRGAVQKVGDQRVPLDFGILANGWISGVVNSAGPIAARGNISLNDFSVNFASNQPFGLISNGKVHLSSGTIHGNVRFVEASSIPNTVQLVGGNTVQESAIDFMQAFRNAEYISQALAGHGVGPVDNYGNLSFVGNEEVNTFSVEAAVLREAHSITIDVPETAGAIINIIGADVAVSNLGVVLNGLAPERLLWNAQQARSFLLSSVGFSGSILAPNAMVDIRNADVKGTIVADTLISASSGLQYAPLDADLLLGVGESSRVSLRPTRQLEPGCKYELVVSSLVPLNEDLLCLEAPLVVPFWVAEKETTPASSELMDTRTDKSGNLIRLAAKDGINTPLEKVWSRYEDALDLDNDELVEVSFARPSSFFSGSQHRFGQFHQGFQVLGYGYFVQSANGGFRSARGRVIKGIGELPSWTMDFEQALDAVLQRVGYVEPWVTDPSRFERPSADLMWVSRTERALASDFELRWVIDFSKSGVKDVSSAHVLADDAARVILLSDSDHCLSSDAIPVGASTATVVTEYNGTRSIPTYEYDDDGQSRIILETPAGQPRRQALIDLAPDENYQFVCDENGDGNWSSGDEAQVATMFWGLLEAENYLANSGFVIDGVPWMTPDTGSGEIEVIWITEAGYVPECTAAAGHSLPWSRTFDEPASNLRARIFANYSASGSGTNPLVMAHEYAHILFNYGRVLVGDTALLPMRQSGAIREGFSDLFALAAVKERVPDDPFWPCMSVGSTCYRDVANPIVTGNADYVGETPYKDFASTPDEECGGRCSAADNDNCGQHDNSTIVSHWAYLLAMGSDAGDPICGTRVDPLVDVDVNESFRRVVDIALHAGVEQVGVAANFDEFRDATAYVADALYPGEDMGRKIESAWHAVGVGGAPAPLAVSPSDGATGVEPWDGDVLSWIPTDDGPWEVELSTHADFCTLSLDDCTLESHEAHRHNSADGPRAALDVDLKPDTKYFWRVRPAGASSWDQCTIIATASFKTAPKRLQFINTRAVNLGFWTEYSGDLYVTAQRGEVVWEPIEDADYELVFSETELDLECDDPSAIVTRSREVTIARDSYDDGIPTPFALAEHSEADKTYHLYARPVAGNDATLTGECSHLRVRYKPLGPFHGVSPNGYDVVAVDLVGQTPPTVSFTKSEGAEAYELQINLNDDETIYRVRREVGDCNLSEENGILTWEFAACDGGGEPDFLSWVEPKNMALYIFSMAGEQRRAAFKRPDLQLQATFRMVPEHMPALHYFDEEDLDGAPGGRWWVTLKGPGVYTEATGWDLEAGYDVLTEDGQLPSVRYDYRLDLAADRNTNNEPIEVELCLKNDFPLATRVAVYSGTGAEEYEGDVYLNGSKDEACFAYPGLTGPSGSSNIHYERLYVLPYNGENAHAEALTELELGIFRLPPDIEPGKNDVEPEPQQCPAELPEVMLSPQFLQGTKAGVVRVDAPDPDDPCDILYSYVFSVDSPIQQWGSFNFSLAQVDGATEYDIVVHPVSFSEQLEEQNCVYRTFPRQAKSEQLFGIISSELPLSEHGAYEFLVRAKNQNNGCDVVGPWSKAGSLQLVQ